ELLRRDVGDQVVEGTGRRLVPEVERLERVVEERGHLAEAPAHQLLDGGGAVGIRVRGRRELCTPEVESKDHREPPVGNGPRRLPGDFSVKQIRAYPPAAD